MVGRSIKPISYSEILSYATLYHLDFSVDEIKAIVLLDDLFLKEINK